MGLLKWLFGEVSEPDSLEARVEYSVDKEVEARMECEVIREVDERRRQAKDRKITEKAIEVLLGFGKCNDNKAHIVDYQYNYHSCPCGEMILSGSITEITYPIYTDSFNDSELTGGIEKIGFRVEIGGGGLTVYRDHGNRENVHSYFFSNVFPDLSRIWSSIFHYSKTIELRDILKYNSWDSITTYIPGDWEGHLDGLYHRIPLVKMEKAEMLTREQEEKLRKEREDKERKVQEDQERKRKEIEDKKKNFGL
jgi:hypothetical protein